MLILDGNEDVQSKKALFIKAWSDEFKGIVEYRPDHVLTGVEVKSMTPRFETADDVKADVLNVIPPQSAGAIARQAGLITVNDQWRRGRFSDVRIDPRARHSRARRFDPDRAADAQVGTHG